jgi:hypothetical protein
MSPKSAIFLSTKLFPPEREEKGREKAGFQMDETTKVGRGVLGRQAPTAPWAEECTGRTLGAF